MRYSPDRGHYRLVEGDAISRKAARSLQSKSSPFVLVILAVGLLTIAAFIFSGCDFTAGADAGSLVPTPSAIVANTPTTAVEKSPATQPADPPTNTVAIVPPNDTAAPTDAVAPTHRPSPELPTYTPQLPATDTAIPPPTNTARPRVPTATEAAAEDSPTAEATSDTSAQATVQPGVTSTSGKMVNGQWYDAYVPAATKVHQYYHYTCEFDAAWVVLETNSIDVTLDDQLAITGQDKSIEPRYEETSNGIFIYGGDILHYYSGDYTSNFLARTTGTVMARVFEHYGLKVTPVHTQEDMEAALRQNELVWIKTTADFKPGKPATWVMPDGTTYQTVLGNDHAAVVMGYSDRGAHIRDVLGPTSTNENRQYEYDVPWPKFMAAWDQQQDDGLAVGK